jgi:hypothetical protein
VPRAYDLPHYGEVEHAGEAASSLARGSTPPRTRGNILRLSEQHLARDVFLGGGLLGSQAFRRVGGATMLNCDARSRDATATGGAED